MGDCFLGEIRLFAGGVVPRGWLACDGQALQINAYINLFALFGTRFGGDGRTYFLLPDLRGRAIVGQSKTDPSYAPGFRGGVENVTLTTENLPAHTHQWMASTQQPNTTRPQGAYLATGSTATGPLYADYDGMALSEMSRSSLSSVGGGMAHSNMQPFTTALYCIAVDGIYPAPA